MTLTDLCKLMGVEEVGCGHTDVDEYGCFDSRGAGVRCSGINRTATYTRLAERWGELEGAARESAEWTGRRDYDWVEDWERSVELAMLARQALAPKEER